MGGEEEGLHHWDLGVVRGERGKRGRAGGDGMEPKRKPAVRPDGLENQDDAPR